jgi:hypothetical protein
MKISNCLDDELAEMNAPEDSFLLAEEGARFLGVCLLSADTAGMDDNAERNLVTWDLGLATF